MLDYPILSCSVLPYPTTDTELKFERKEKMFRVEKSKEILQDKWEVTQLSYLHHSKCPGLTNLNSSVNQPPSCISLQLTNANKQTNKQTDPKRKQNQYTPLPLPLPLPLPPPLPYRSLPFSYSQSSLRAVDL